MSEADQNQSRNRNQNADLKGVTLSVQAVLDGLQKLQANASEAEHLSKNIIRPATYGEGQRGEAEEAANQEEKRRKELTSELATLMTKLDGQVREARQAIEPIHQDFAAARETPYLIQSPKTQRECGSWRIRVRAVDIEQASAHAAVILLAEQLLSQCLQAAKVALIPSENIEVHADELVPDARDTFELRDFEDIEPRPGLLSQNPGWANKLTDPQLFHIRNWSIYYMNLPGELEKIRAHVEIELGQAEKHKLSFEGETGSLISNGPDLGVTWRPIQKFVEVSKGEYRRLLDTPRYARLFKSVAECSPSNVMWKDILSSWLKEDGRLTVTSTDSLRRYGRTIIEDLGELGAYWKQDRLGAHWVPPNSL